MLYNYTPKEAVIETIVEEKKEDIGLFNNWFGIDLSNLESAESVIISNKDDLDLITNMMLEYNNMNTAGVSSFFADSCHFYDLNANKHILTKTDFESFFNNMDSVRWRPASIVPLKLRDHADMRTATIVHSFEERYKKDGSFWMRELLEVFYIKENKIIEVNQFGKESLKFKE